MRVSTCSRLVLAGHVDKHRCCHHAHCVQRAETLSEITRKECQHCLACSPMRCLHMQVFEDMQAAGIEPNSYIYTGLLIACETRNDWRRAVSIFNRMLVRFCAPA